MTSDDRRVIVVFHRASSDDIGLDRLSQFCRATNFENFKISAPTAPTKKCRASIGHLSYLSGHHRICRATVVQPTGHYRLSIARMSGEIYTPYDHRMAIRGLHDSADSDPRVTRRWHDGKPTKYVSSCQAKRDPMATRPLPDGRPTVSLWWDDGQPTKPIDVRRIAAYKGGAAACEPTVFVPLIQTTVTRWGRKPTLADLAKGKVNHVKMLL